MVDSNLVMALVPGAITPNVADLSDESFLAGLDFPDRAPIERYLPASAGRHSKPLAHAHFGWLNVAFRFVARPTRS
ncbi:hypothetical protein D9M68_237410 [compost metagenome]